jgi:glycosyltransferase involved in cell wall biosynthesis
MMRGGGETQHLAWIRGLLKLGVEVDIITGRPVLRPPLYPMNGDATTVIRSPYVRDMVYKVQGRRVVGRLGSLALHADEEWFCRAAWNRIAALPRQPDLVLAHALHQAPRLRTVDVPVAVYLPGPPHPRYLQDLRLADALISDGWAAKHLPGQIGRPVDDVLKGVDTNLFTPEGPNQRQALGLERARVILCVTRLVPIKNVPLLIGAVAELRRRGRDAVLLLVGEGPQQAEIEALARQHGIAEAVRFIGYVPQEQTPVWYRTADVFALSSDFDNSPNVVLEAMASALPIVATDVGGLRDYVTPGRHGALVAKGSMAELAAALERYVDDPSLARETGRRNREEAVERFSWDVSSARMRDVYARIVDVWRRTHPS